MIFGGDKKKRKDKVKGKNTKQEKLYKKSKKSRNKQKVNIEYKKKENKQYCKQYSQGIVAFVSQKTNTQRLARLKGQHKYM